MALTSRLACMRLWEHCAHEKTDDERCLSHWRARCDRCVSVWHLITGPHGRSPYRSQVRYHHLSCRRPQITTAPCRPSTVRASTDPRLGL
jgi:hypothetical protein